MTLSMYSRAVISAACAAYPGMRPPMTMRMRLRSRASRLRASYSRVASFSRRNSGSTMISMPYNVEPLGV